jgi:PKD repeat protein
MKKTINILTVLAMLLVISCTKKKYPENIIENEPVFYASATIGGTSYRYSAGINSYAMYASYAQDSSGVYNLIGEIKQKGCGAGCPGSIRFQVNDFKISAVSAPVEITNSIKVQQYFYANVPQEIVFHASYNKSAASYRWDFGDGTTSSLANPSHVYYKNGRYKVQLTVAGVGGCGSTVANWLNVGFPEPLNAFVTQTFSGGKTLQFSGQARGGKAPYRYFWNFGDGDTSDLVSPAHTYKYNGSYPVTLRVTDAIGDTIRTTYNAVTQSDNSSCAANYSVSPGIGISSRINAILSSVVVSWTDETGSTYSSGQVKQPSSSNFEVVAVEDYDNNERGERTRKVKVKFACLLSNGVKTVSLNNAEAAICVAYK